MSRKMTQEQRKEFFQCDEQGLPTYESMCITNALLMRYGEHLPKTHRVGRWKGPWQSAAARHLAKHRKCGIKLSRQAGGKTQDVALYIVPALLTGSVWATFMPTLIQSTRILVKRVSLWMNVLEPHFGLRRIKKEERLKEWDNGAALLALSDNPEANANLEGYTVDGASVDESHQIDWDILGNITALMKDAEKERRERLFLIGVGGYEESAIEQAPLHGYPVIEFNDAAISAMDDEARAGMAPDDPRLKEFSWREVFAAEEVAHPATYDQFYRLLQVTAGTRLMFGELPEEVLPVSPYHARRFRFGIDVGKLHDRTVLNIDEVRGPICNTVAVHEWAGCNYMRQRDELCEIIQRYPFTLGDIGIGVAGPGEVLADAMAELYPFHGITRVKESDTPGVRMGSRMKTHWLKDLMEEARCGRWGVKPAGARRHFSKLAYSFTAGGDYVWPHSDEMAAKMISHATQYQPVGV